MRIQVTWGRLVARLQDRLPLLQRVRTPEMIFDRVQAVLSVARRATNDLGVLRFV